MNFKERFVDVINTQNNTTLSVDDIEIEAVTPLSMDTNSVNTRVGYKILKQDGLQSGYIGRTIDYRRLDVRELLGEDTVSIPLSHWDGPPQLERVVEAINQEFLEVDLEVGDFYEPERVYPGDDDRHEYLVLVRDDSLRFTGEFLIKPKVS